MQWIPRPDFRELENGDTFLVAVAVCNDGSRVSIAKRHRWELTVVTVACGEHYFSLWMGDNDDFGWEWDDIEWVIPIAELTRSLPPIVVPEKFT